MIKAITTPITMGRVLRDAVETLLGLGVEVIMGAELELVNIGGVGLGVGKF